MKKEVICSVFSNIPTLRTERLTLRRMSINDTDDMFDYAKRQDVTEYLLWYPHQSKKYTSDYLRYIGTRYNLGEFYDWAVIETQSGRMIGTCGFTRFDLPHNSAEIGYVLNPEFHGKGYATEAAERVLEFGFEDLSLHRIEAKFMQGNDASLHVMKKLGMKFEGYHRDALFVKGKYRTVGYASILRDEYYQRKQNH